MLFFIARPEQKNNTAKLPDIGLMLNFATMKMSKRVLLFMMLIWCACVPDCRAFSLALDSIAAWGKFPHFCIDVYRWGDRFFNTYDSTYVVGTGKKFNIKSKTESWIDYYDFQFENRTRMSMISDPCTSTGFYLTYLAVSIGYDVNVSKYIGGNPKSRRRLNFGFSCSLIAADFFFISNDVGTRITRFGPPGNVTDPDLDFNSINTSTWGVDAYYFFNHKNYSQAAAFSFSKIQKKTSGTLFAGFTYFSQNYNFDFNNTPDYIKKELPKSWTDYYYRVLNHNYALKVGYAYNIVLPHDWLIGLSEAPTLGVRTGYISDPSLSKTTFSFSNRFKASAVYNHGNWFVGVVGDFDTGLVYDKEHTLLNMMWSVNASVGYRFNLW